MCFRAFSRDKLDHTHKLLDLSIDLNDFIDIYDHVMKDAKIPRGFTQDKFTCISIVMWKTSNYDGL